MLDQENTVWFFSHKHPLSSSFNVPASRFSSVFSKQTRRCRLVPVCTGCACCLLPCVYPAYAVPLSRVSS